MDKNLEASAFMEQIKRDFVRTVYRSQAKNKVELRCDLESAIHDRVCDFHDLPSDSVSVSSSSDNCGKVTFTVTESVPQSSCTVFVDCSRK